VRSRGWEFMVKASKGPRRRTRSKLRKKVRDRGMSPISRSLQTFKVGDHAFIEIDPSVHRGQPHPRYQGLSGVVMGTQGRSYVLEVRTGGKRRRLIVFPAHLKTAGG
jgi:large subunit ribosomal protein L21e